MFQENMYIHFYSVVGDLGKFRCGSDSDGPKRADEKRFVSDLELDERHVLPGLLDLAERFDRVLNDPEISHNGRICIYAGAKRGLTKN